MLVRMSFLNCNAIPLSSVRLKCVLINDKECTTRPEIININSNEPTFYHLYY